MASGFERGTTKIDEIRDNFALLDEWDDRYRYVIELGRTLAPMPEAGHSQANKVQGCASQVWLSRQIERGADTADVPVVLRMVLMLENVECRVN
jgi:sulfur transfer protein SufE